MESNTYCTSCKAFKALSEFISYGAKGGSKQLKTCNNCRQRFQKSDKKRKRYVEKNDSQPSTLDIVDIDFFNEVGLLLILSQKLEKNFLLIIFNKQLNFVLKNLEKMYGP